MSSDTDESILSSSIRKWTLIASVAGLACAGIGYALYFDYKRRHDPVFRASLAKKQQEEEALIKKKEQEELEKRQMQEQTDNKQLRTQVTASRHGSMSDSTSSVTSARSVTVQEIEEVAEVKKTESGPFHTAGKKSNSSPSIDATLASAFANVPPEMLKGMAKADLPLEDLLRLDPEERQSVFYSILVKAESMLKLTPVNGSAKSTAGARHAAAINYFVKAAMLVPSPFDVLNAYQTTLDEETFIEVVQKFQEVNIKKSKEYMDGCVQGQDWFKFELVAVPESKEHPIAWAPIAKQDIEKDRVIFTEQGDVTLELPSDVVKTTPAEDCPFRNLCERCFKPCVGKDGSEFISCQLCGQGRFCSTDCRTAAFSSFHFVTCSGHRGGVVDGSAQTSNSNVSKTGTMTNAPLQKLFDYCRKERQVMPLLMLKYLSILLGEELKGNSSAVGGPFLHFDHLSKVIIKEAADKQDILEASLIRDIFALADKNMGDFLQDPIYASMRATVQANAYGIRQGNDQDASALLIQRLHRPGTQFMFLGLYHTLSHIPHSCEPNCEFFIQEGAVLALRALRPIAKGETLSVCYLGKDQQFMLKTGVHERAKQLKRLFNFDCRCDLCCNLDKRRDTKSIVTNEKECCHGDACHQEGSLITNDQCDGERNASIATNSLTITDASLSLD